MWCDVVMCGVVMRDVVMDVFLICDDVAGVVTDVVCMGLCVVGVFTL